MQATAFFLSTGVIGISYNRWECFLDCDILLSISIVTAFLILLHYTLLTLLRKVTYFKPSRLRQNDSIYSHHITIMDDHQSLFPRKSGQADFDFYPYNPSNVAGYIFMALFAVGSVVHLGYIIPYRTWYCIPFLLGCVGKSQHHIQPLD